MTASTDRRWRSWAQYNLGIQEKLLSQELSADPAVMKAQRRAITRRLEKLLLRAIALLRPELVVEIGAHGGEFSMAARRRLPDAKIVAFEANKTIYDRHAAKLQASRIEFHQIAISDKSGARSFGVPRYRGKPAESMGSLRKDRLAEDIDWVEVSCARADSVLADAADLPNVLWIDVEGAAPEVLAGCHGLLGSTQLIYVEIETRQRWENQGLADKVFEFLEPFGLIPLLRDVMRNKWQYNCLIGRPEIVEIPRIVHLFDKYIIRNPDE